MKSQKINYNTLKNIVLDIFLSYGYSLEDSQKISDIIITADLYGIKTHGIERVPMYHNKIKNQKIDISAKSTVLNNNSISISFDAHNRIGQLAAYDAMDIAIKKAKEFGIGMTNVLNSNNFGIAGYYSKMAANVDLIGICLTNTPPFCIPTNGRNAALGTNPISICIPAEPYPFYMDISTTITSLGKIEVYKKMKKMLPKGWVVDDNGNDITNPAQAIDNISKNIGGLLPIGGNNILHGGHKGFALSLLVELLTTTLFNTKTLCNTYNISHFFCAIDYGIFGDKHIIKKNVSDLLNKIKNSKGNNINASIIIPGEIEFNNELKAKKEGIYLHHSTLLELNTIMEECNLNLKNYF